MFKLFRHKKTGVLVWDRSEDFGSQWEIVPGCWMDEMSRPWEDKQEEIWWIENSIMIKGRRIGPFI